MQWYSIVRRRSLFKLELLEVIYYKIIRLLKLAYHKGGQCATKPQHGRGSKRSGLVREAVISEQNGVSAAESDLSTSFMTNSLGG